MSDTMMREGRTVLKRLTEAGYDAYFVGGCVRDALLGRPLKDIDIATSALPQQVMELFERTVPTGLAHGTVTVLVNRLPIEVTTFRSESEYEGFRRPKEVAFISDLGEDLRRRDFTINAMALDAVGSCIDPYGGADDLKKRIVRCVGDPMERFSEDALRMLRAIRFACGYGFRIDSGTWQALVRHAPLLAHVAMERVRAELERMMEGSAPDRAIRLLAASGLARHVKTPIDWPLASSWKLPDPVITGQLVLAEPDLRWAALFLLIGMTSGGAREAMRRLTFSSVKSETVYRVLQIQEWLEGQEPGYAAEAEACVRFGEPSVRQWLVFVEWQYQALGGSWFTPYLDNGERWLAQLPVWEMERLAIGGAEVLAATGKQAGPWLGLLLRELLLLAAQRQLPNERDVLLANAKLLAEQE